jgi:hypothetical protein
MSSRALHNEIDWDCLAAGLLGVTRNVLAAIEQEADVIAYGQERTTTCAVDGCLVLLDEVCPACRRRVTHV